MRAVRRACAAALVAAAPVAHATNLDLRILSAGQPTVQVSPGAVVPYDVVGELSDAANDGLALFSFDLAFDGGPLAPAGAPSSPPLLSFAVPAGVNNPQGFGGVAVPGGLRQVGGGQNTINNSFGPYPIGSVTTGVAQPGQPVTLVSGQLTAPQQPGSYTLAVTRVVANVIAAGAGGVPVWKVEPAAAGTLAALAVQVQTPARASRARRFNGVAQ